MLIRPSSFLFIVLVFFTNYYYYCCSARNLGGKADEIVELIANNSEKQSEIIRNSFISNILNGIVYDVEIGIEIYNIIKGHSSDCKFHVVKFLIALFKKKEWAWKMIDASSKIPSGILDGNFRDLGAYDECINVNADNYFTGQYCFIIITNQTNVKLMEKSDNPFVLGPTVSCCIPSTCSADNFQDTLNVALNRINLTGQVMDDSCTTNQTRPFHLTDFVLLFIVLLSIVLVAMSTIYDLYIYRNEETTAGDKFEPLTYFSIHKNAHTLLHKRSPTGTLSCLNGLRFLSICWVVIGHRYIMTAIFPLFNLRDAATFMEAWQSCIILNGILSVDVFFLLSGLLLSYNFLRRNSANECAIRFSLASYLHRYIRLTPVYGFLILLQLSTYERFGNGPIWNFVNKRLTGYCVDNWWLSLIYINNYFHKSETCLLQSWYLNVDMQLFILSPLILYPVERFRKKGIFIILLLLLIEIATIFFISYVNELRAGPVATIDNRTTRTVDMLYTYTHTRAGPWLIGLGLGSVLAFQQIPQRSFRMPKIVVALGWITSLVLCIGTIYSLSLFQETGQPYNRIRESLYLSLYSTVWAFGVSWIIFACVTGYGGFINTFLSCGIFYTLAKLTYCIYLTQFQVMFLQAARERTPMYFSDFLLVYRFIGDMFIITMIAAVLYLFIECPIISLSRYIFKN